MNPIGYESKNAVGKQKISSKYHQLVEKCNSLHVSIGTKKIAPWKIAPRKINPHPNPNPNLNPNPGKNLLGGNLPGGNFTVINFPVTVSIRCVVQLIDFN